MLTQTSLSGQFHKIARPLVGSVTRLVHTASIYISRPRGIYNVLGAEARLSLSCLLSGCTGGEDVPQGLRQSLPQGPEPALFYCMGSPIAPLQSGKLTCD